MSNESTLPSASTQEDVSACLRYGEELKSEGNDHFRAGNWNEALAEYRSGLSRLPQRREKKVVIDLPNTEDAASKNDASRDDEGEEELAETELSKECAKVRAVLNANIAACHVKLGEHKEAIEACSQALHDDPDYVKVLQRRASSNEILGTWTSLSAAQEDYNALLRILPQSDSRHRDVSLVLQKLKPRLEAAQKQETAEMLDKLKGFGNNILGRFGMSTDNFQFVPNGQGGYSVNFTR
ncbi:hypothetical protein AX17_000829 [Amanita inopinata Kibby_2008]|nr:hypothetical protein AX17_000829 [Amanita inopinata Kibby_2008]